MFVLVVGPSGAGKDTLLGMAGLALAADSRFRFVRRVITRPAGAGGEDHEAVSDAVFAQRSFALRWRAHGLSYGIPIEVTDDLARGLVVVANVSRGVIAAAADRFSLRVVEVTAAPAVLAQRLNDRGRETTDDVAKRLARSVPIPPHVVVDTIVNDTTPEAAAERFVAALIRAASPARPG